MKFTSALALGAMVASASAQAASTAADFPKCAQTCVTKYAPKVGCSATDTKCQCEKSEEFIKVGSECVYNGCSKNDVDKAQTVFAEICKALNGTTAAI